MKESKRRTTPKPPHASPDPANFGSWLAGRLGTLGFDVSGPRSGGRARFAAKSGLSPSAVTRFLKSELPTDTRTLRTLAEAIDVPYAEVLVRAGVITANELAAVQRPTTTRHITPDQAADELGIDDPVERKVFVNMAQTLSRTAPEEGEQQLAD
ncbi:XRE family transcriptional regulator [Streptomyces sp. NPDC017940]|uniref:XRE family transcriptional regulator n=1 Tax=Streptomyces sp. NPDC017940 TaxID=3365017 RepID=UPI0037A5A8C6